MSPAGRLLYLDNLRSFCMLFVVYSHAAALGDFGWTESPAVLMGHFAMQSFFLVSGFFSAAALSRTDARSFLAKRAVYLGVPLVATLILVNPVMIHLRHGFLNGLPYGSYSFNEALAGVIAARWDGPELHLWFLGVLLVYTLMLTQADGRLKALAARIGRVAGWKMIALFAAAVLAIALVKTVLLRVAPAQVPRLLLPFVTDLPYFFAGALAFHSDRFRDALHRPVLPALMLLVGAGLATLYRGPGWGYADALGMALVGLAIVLLLNWLMLTFANRANAATRILSDSMFTIYLFHMLFLFLFVRVAGYHLGDMTVPDFVAATVFATLAGLVLHRFAIARVPLLGLLFNGRIPSRGRAATPAG